LNKLEDLSAKQNGRRYSQKTTLLNPLPGWLDSGLGVIAPDGACMTRTLSDVTAPCAFIASKL